jgi:hypothetical protein
LMRLASRGSAGDNNGASRALLRAFRHGHHAFACNLTGRSSPRKRGPRAIICVALGSRLRGNERRLLLRGELQS